MDIESQVNGKKRGYAPKFPTREFGYFRDDQIMFLVTHGTGKLSDALLEEFKKQVNTHLESLKGGTIEVLPQSFSFPEVTDQLGRERLAELQKLEDDLMNNKDEQDKRDRKLKELEIKLKDKKEEDLTELQKFLLSGSYTPSTYQRKPFPDAFSLLVCNLEGAPDEPLSLLMNILELRRSLNGNRISTEPQIDITGTPEAITEEPESVTATPKALAETPEINTMQIEDVSPNWVMSAASNGSGTGGPGGLPSPFKGKDRDVGNQYKFDIIDRLGDLCGKGANVDVVILDTAPCLHDLVLAIKEWPDNDLIKGLLGKGGKLTVYPATYEELRRMENASLDRHDYDMSNHGLFAAGIVHSIVPEANIHLIEVLNQFGVGDLESLAGGLKKAFDQIYQPGSGRRLVVNCSWMLDLPLSEDHCKAKEDKNPKKRHPEYDFEESILYFDLKDREQASALWATCNSIFLAGGQVVAAAGNDWEWSKKRKEENDNAMTVTSGAKTQEPRDEAPEARYPASFVSVVGVGALPKSAAPKTKGKFAASSYSNLGDKPAGDGIMTLGGEEGDRQGVLGLYLGDEFPIEEKSEPNSENYKRKIRMIKRKDDDDNNEKNSWAWWAGTSFATPILSGTIAARVSVEGPEDPGDAPKAVKALYRAVVKNLPTTRIIEPDGTDANEDVMYVAQGN